MTHIDPFFLRESIDKMIDTINLHAINYHNGKEISSKVIDAIRQVSRHKFIKTFSYEDRPVPIGYDQTISQPFIVAYMTDMLDIEPSHKVLEIGTGSGYQAAIISKLCKEVYTVERIKELVEQTKPLLTEYKNIKTNTGNGYDGWEDHAPYDRIMVTAMAKKIPQELVNQLVYNGKMIIPVKGQLIKITKTGEERMCECGMSADMPYCDDTHLGSGIEPSITSEYTEKSLIGVRFVPLVE